MAQGGESNQNQVKDPASLQCSAMDSIVTTVHFYDNLRSFKGILPVTVVKELEYYYNTVYGPRGVKRFRNRRVPPQLTVFNDSIVQYPVKHDVVRYIEEYKPPDKPETAVFLQHRYCRYCWQQHVSKFIPKSKLCRASVDNTTKSVAGWYVRFNPQYFVCNRCSLTMYKINPKYDVIKHSKMYRDVKAKYGLD